MDEERICANCGEELDEEDEGYDTADGELICSLCFEEEYFECGDCGRIYQTDEAEYYGDTPLCHECMQKVCPDFDENMNSIETWHSYQAFCRYFTGVRVRPEFSHFSEELTWEEDGRKWTLPFETDGESYIVSIGRLTCEMTLSEGICTSDIRPYPVSDEDYRKAAFLMERDILEGFEYR